MKKFFKLIILSCSFLYINSAHSACTGPATTWSDIGSNPIYNYPATTDGAPCRHFLSTNVAIFENSYVVRKPKFGVLVQENLHTFIYTPKKGYKGKDDYSYKICGNQNGRKGCITMERNVTVE